MVACSLQREVCEAMKRFAEGLGVSALSLVLIDVLLLSCYESGLWMLYVNLIALAFSMFCWYVFPIMLDWKY